MTDEEKTTALNDTYYGYLREFKDQQKAISGGVNDPSEYEYFRGRLDGYMNCFRIMAGALANFGKKTHEG